MTKKKIKHNYTSELELKSLLIRIKNEKSEIGLNDKNSIINKYITWHTKINNKKYQDPSKRNIVKSKLKERIIVLSEKTKIDLDSYERFGAIVLLMIKNILRKPQFSGYTYKDDFYSDAVYKILKYLHNFDHTMLSERTGLPVNSFAYVSQIIHNSILFILNHKKKEAINHKKQATLESLTHDLSLPFMPVEDSLYREANIPEVKHEIIEIDFIETSLYESLKEIDLEYNCNTSITVYYPNDYVITFDEYNQIKPLIKGNMSIVRSEKED